MFFFFKQKTAYEMRISDWSSDVCSSDLNPLTWRGNFDRLVDLIWRGRVDLVHARSRMPAWLAWRAARRNRVPFVTTFHQRPAAATALKRAYNSVMVKGDRVIAISHHVAGRLIDDYGLDRARLRVIQRGVDLGLFDPEREIGRAHV